MKILVLLVTALLGAAPAHAANSADRVSLYSCKFGNECVITNPDCKNYDSWDLIRWYPSDRQHTVFSALGSRGMKADHFKIGDLQVWKTTEVTNGPKRSSNIDLLVLTPDMQAARTGAAYVEFDPGDMRFYANVTHGMCQEIN